MRAPLSRTSSFGAPLLAAFAFLSQACNENAVQSPDSQLLDFDYTALVQLGIFVVVAIALNQLLWKPYLKIKGERIHRVDGYREEAKQMEVDAQTRLARIDAQLADTRRVGSVERSKARAQAAAEEARIVAEAQAVAQRALAEAKARVEASLAAERASVTARAEALANDAANRVLGRRVA
jgi:F-type H+-transporting ATPase subunit b